MSCNFYSVAIFTQVSTHEQGVVSQSACFNKRIQCQNAYGGREKTPQMEKTRFFQVTAAQYC